MPLGALTAGLLLPAILSAGPDPAKIVGAEACGECHLAEHEVWKSTPHATGFKTLHRKSSAETIAGKLGFRLIKRDSLCLECHYTVQQEDGEPGGGPLRALSGVSCESCHGAARDWIDVHNDYGAGFDHATEPAEHKRQRIEASRAAGMRRPSDLYATAASCFGCHTVPEEELVNVGGHSTGSAGFELVAWSQGEIRHNFLDSFLGGDGTENRQRTAEEKRRMYVVGRALDLEYSLRAAAEATGKGIYAKALQRRVRVALAEVREIGSRAELSEVEAMVAALRGAKVLPGNRQELLAAAEAVGKAARGFLEGHDGSRLASLDPLVLGLPDRLAEDLGDLSQDPLGDTPEDYSGDSSEDSAEPGDSRRIATANGATNAAPGSPSGSTALASTGGGDPGQPAVGEKHRRLRPPWGHGTVGPGACSGCHEDANTWWFGDPHSRSAEPFFESSAKNLRIARLYGISSAAIARGSSLCMDCHGTIISGRERREVFDGVSCESCHGAAADYVEPHKEGDKSLGEARPGYQQALRLGMVKLDDLGERAKVCTGCHYVTDERLLSAGHPSGEAFNYVTAMGSIRHWPHPTAAAGAITTAFTGQVRSRGPVPQVQLARLPSRAEAALASAPAATSSRGRPTGGPAAATGGAWNRPRPAALGSVSSGLRRPRGAAVAVPALPTGTARGALELPPFPQVDASTPIEDVLLLVHRRLELLYQELGLGRPQKGMPAP